MSTTAELVTKVRDRFGEDSTTATQVSDAQILKYLNDRQIELCADTDCLVSSWVASTVAAQQIYSVPPEYTFIRAIQLYQTTGDLAKWWVKKVEIDDLDPNKSAGPPERFAVWGANVSGDNSLVFYLDPIPKSNGTSDLYCHGRQLPKAMVSAGQGPEVRQAEQNLLVLGTIADVYLRLAAADPALISLADRAEAKWQAGKRDTQFKFTVEYSVPMGPKDTMGYASR